MNARDPRPGIADWLCLAAAPTFAAMALITLVLESGPAAMLCSAAPDASALTGMAPMYLLMSAFHSVPWLKLIAGRRRRAFESRHTCHSRDSAAGPNSSHDHQPA